MSATLTDPSTNQPLLCPTKQGVPIRLTISLRYTLVEKCIVFTG